MKFTDVFGLNLILGNCIAKLKQQGFEARTGHHSCYCANVYDDFFDADYENAKWVITKNDYPKIREVIICDDRTASIVWDDEYSQMAVHNMTGVTVTGGVFEKVFPSQRIIVAFGRSDFDAWEQFAFKTEAASLPVLQSPETTDRTYSE